MSAHNTPKSMSSRLLTMNFMRRAAASNPASPAQASPAEPSPKRRKTEDSPVGKFDVNALANQRAVESALAAEEAKRQAALERQAELAGDTHWVLGSSDSTPSRRVMRVVHTGYASIDRDASGGVAHYEPDSSEEAFEAQNTQIGRKSFGRFNRAIEKLNDPTIDSESSESESEDEAEEPEDRDDAEDSDLDVMIKEQRKEAEKEAVEKLKAERKAKKRAAKEEAKRLAEERKKKVVKLNQLSSISGTGGSDFRQSSGSNSRQSFGSGSAGPCYKCGGQGHIAMYCPDQKHDRSDDDSDERSKKSKKKKHRHST